MTRDEIRSLCLSFPGATQTVQWGDSLVFKVADKMFWVGSNSGPLHFSFKASDDSFHLLTEMPDIRPAPYLARAKWVRLDAPDALPRDELKAYLRRSYDLVVAKLPKAVRASLS